MHKHLKNHYIPLGNKQKYYLFMTYLHTYKIGFIQYILHSTLKMNIIFWEQKSKFLNNLYITQHLLEYRKFAFTNTNSCSKFFSSQGTKKIQQHIKVTELTLSILLICIIFNRCT